MLQDRHLDYSGSILIHVDCDERIERSKNMDGGSLNSVCHIHDGSWAMSKTKYEGLPQNIIW